MRTTHTFVLRLWMDTDEPYRLRGTLHSIADDTDYPFANVLALLDLLRQMTSGAADFQGLRDFESLKNQEGGNDEHGN